MCNILIKDIEWFEVESILRNLTVCEDTEELSEDDWIHIDNLKTSFIALMGFKLFSDNNEIFYNNMKTQANTSLQYMANRFPNKKRTFNKIDTFINETL